jgi:hypothetical protein
VVEDAGEVGRDKVGGLFESDRCFGRCHRDGGREGGQLDGWKGGWRSWGYQRVTCLGLWIRSAGEVEDGADRDEQQGRRKPAIPEPLPW